MNKEKARLQFIDMFRGFAVLAMVQAHVDNATILPSLQKQSTFHYLDIFNGTISGCFILIAGFAISLFLEKRWEDVLHLRKSLWNQVRRLLFVLFLGYWLHTPFWSLKQMLHMNEAALTEFLRADVLMLIALALLLTLFAAVLVRTRATHAWFMFALAFGVILVTPFLYEINARETLPRAMAAFVNSSSDNASLFPLFPYAAYSFVGTFLSWLYLKMSGEGKERRLFLFLLIAGPLMTAVSFALFYGPWQYHHYVDVAKESPRSFTLRLGVVFFFLSVTWFYEQWRKPGKSMLAALGQESLFVYAFHLMIVYGSVFTTWNLASYIGRTLTYLPSFGISVLLIAFVSAIALVWHWMKQNHPKPAKAMFYAFWVFYALIFLIN